MTDLFAASPIVRALGWALLQSLWQGALIGGVTALALLMLRNGPPNRRYLTACAGLLAMTLAFAGTAARAAIDTRPPSSAANAIAATPSPILAPAAIPAAPGAIDAAARAGRAAAPRPRDLLTTWSIAAVPAWLIGVLLLSGRLAAGWLLVRRIRREAARPVPEVWCARVAALSNRLRISRAVRVVESGLVAVPTVIGWLRPAILLPVSALSGLTGAQLEAILAHELAHIRRHDYLVNLFQSAAEVLLFYHPLTWWISRRIRAEREHCCDDAAAGACGSRFVYARALADLAALRDGSATPGLAATDGPLFDRIRRLVTAPAVERSSSPAWVATGLVATVLAVAFTGEPARSAAAGPEPAVAQSATPGPGPGIPPGEGVVRGRVVDADSGEPIAGAHVQLDADGRTRSGPPPSPDVLLPVAMAHETSSGPDGTYEIRGVVPGEYFAAASAAGYVPSEPGELPPPIERRYLSVSGGRITADVDLRLRASGAVSGRVIGDDGNGVPGVEVELLRDSGAPGAAGRVAIAFAQSETGGIYRFRDVAPGEYYLRAYASTSIRPTREAGSVYVPTFLPGVTQPENAHPLVVSSGQELSGFDVTLATAKTHVVRGNVIDPTGASVDGVMVALGSWGAGSVEGGSVGSDGRFELRDVPPGRYLLMAMEPRNFSRWLGTRRMIEVTADISNLELVAEPAARLNGRLAGEDGRPLPFDLDRIEIGLEYRDEGTPFPTTWMAGRDVEVDGTFQVEGPGGRSWLNVTELPPGWIVKSVRLDGVDVTDTPLDLAPAARHRLEIVLSNRPAVLTGLVTDGRNRPVPQAMVIVFPEDRHRWTVTRLTRAAYALGNGWYEILELPPGSYRVAATTAIPATPPARWRNPDVLERLWSSSTPVVLREGQRLTVPLRLSP